jgi:hypothetical protein
VAEIDLSKIQNIQHIHELSVLAGMLAERCNDLALQLEETKKVRSTLGLEPDAPTWTVMARLEYRTQMCNEHVYLVDSLSVLFGMLPGDDEESRVFNVRLLERIKGLVRAQKKTQKASPKRGR